MAANTIQPRPRRGGVGGEGGTITGGGTAVAGGCATGGGVTFSSIAGENTSVKALGQGVIEAAGVRQPGMLLAPVQACEQR